MSPQLSTEQFRSNEAVILVADLSGYHRGFRTHSDVEMVQFLDRFYRMAEEVVSSFGGYVVKFIGDAVLAIFEEKQGPNAVSAAVTMEVAAMKIADEAGFDLRLGANIHAGEVIDDELGGGSSRRRDVIGRVVNQTFLLGRGQGIRISERVYRQLPSGDRSPWDKNRPPAVYVLGQSPEPYAGLRSTAAETALKW